MDHDGGDERHGGSSKRKRRKGAARAIAPAARTCQRERERENSVYVRRSSTLRSRPPSLDLDIDCPLEQDNNALSRALRVQERDAAYLNPGIIGHNNHDGSA